MCVDLVKLQQYVRTTYGPPFVGQHGDAFRRSSPCDLPPLEPDSPRPCRGSIQEIPPCRDSKRLRSFVPRHLVGSANCHQVSPQRFHIGLGMVRYLLLRKHLGTIPPIVFIPNKTASACNMPRRGHLRLPKICQLQRPAQSVPVSLFGDRRLPILPLT